LFSFDLLPGRLYQGTMSDSTTIAITSTGFPSGTGKIIGGKAYGVHAITYSVTASDGNPVGVGVLRRNENTGSGAQPLAGDGTTTFVEDLQFAYQVAGDATNWHNTSAEAGTTNDNITMVRINLVVRTAVEDAKDQNYTRPSLEDHPGSGTKDGYRRRVYTTDVKVRNL
jgi:hypothetical protein